MDDYTRKLRLTNTRTRTGAISDVSGTIGDWPFRRAISYHVGVNCDAISDRDGQLYVLRHGRTIAIAESRAAPSPLAHMLRSAWEALLHPRHARRTSGEEKPPITWGDLLRPRRRK